MGHVILYIYTFTFQSYLSLLDGNTPFFRPSPWNHSDPSSTIHPYSRPATGSVLETANHQDISEHRAR